MLFFFNVPDDDFGSESKSCYNIACLLTLSPHGQLHVLPTYLPYSAYLHTSCCMCLKHKAYGFVCANMRFRRCSKGVSIQPCCMRYGSKQILHSCCLKSSYVTPEHWNWQNLETKPTIQASTCMRRHTVASSTHRLSFKVLRYASNTFAPVWGYYIFPSCRQALATHPTKRSPRGHSSRPERRMTDGVW